MRLAYGEGKKDIAQMCFVVMQVHFFHHPESTEKYSMRGKAVSTMFPEVHEVHAPTHSTCCFLPFFLQRSCVLLSGILTSIVFIVVHVCSAFARAAASFTAYAIVCTAWQQSPT